MEIILMDLNFQNMHFMQLTDIEENTHLPW